MEDLTMKKRELRQKTKSELLALATKLEVAGRHKMNKEELIEYIIKTQRRSDRKTDREYPRINTGRTTSKKKMAERAKKTRRKLDFSLKTHRIREIIEKKWQQDVEKTKFEIVAAPREPDFTYRQDLPEAYGETRITLMIRDPYWAYAYWEITPEGLAEVKRKIIDNADNGNETKTILRVYDITGISFAGDNAHSFFDVEINPFANNWYINLTTPNRTYCVDIGVKTLKGDFYLLARSNEISTPSAWMSDIIDEQWMSPEEDFEKVYALSGGYRVGAGSLELQELVKKRLQEQISSPAISSMASEVVARQEQQRGFWLNLGAELIVYGATEPDAKVFLQGKQLPLRPDGTFSVRFALPDGKQVIPVTAESSDGIETRSIIPSVTRSTQRPAPRIKKQAIT
jgi:hypothetical protein